MESHSFQKQFKNMGIDKNRVLNADKSVSDDYSSNSSPSSHNERKVYVSQSRNQNNDALINKMFNTLIDLKRSTKEEIIELKEENKALNNEIKILKRELCNITSNNFNNHKNNDVKKHDDSRKVKNENNMNSMCNDSNNSHTKKVVQTPQKQPKKKKSKRKGSSRSDFSPEEISIESHFNFNK